MSDQIKFWSAATSTNPTEGYHTATPIYYSEVQVMDRSGSPDKYIGQCLYFVRKPSGGGGNWYAWFTTEEQLLAAVKLLREQGMTINDYTKSKITASGSSTNVYEGGKKMVKQISEDMKKFIADNREVIYVIIGIALLDQVLFGGAFRARLQSLINSVLSKAEEKINPTKVIDTMATKVS